MDYVLIIMIKALLSGIKRGYYRALAMRTISLLKLQVGLSLFVLQSLLRSNAHSLVVLKTDQNHSKQLQTIGIYHRRKPC